MNATQFRPSFDIWSAVACSRLAADRIEHRSMRVDDRGDHPLTQVVCASGLADPPLPREASFAHRKAEASFRTPEVLHAHRESSLPRLLAAFQDHLKFLCGEQIPWSTHCPFGIDESFQRQGVDRELAQVERCAPLEAILIVPDSQDLAKAIQDTYNPYADRDFSSPYERPAPR